MSEPNPSEKLLTEIRDDQRQHLAEYRQFIGEVRAQQAKARKGARVILLLLFLLAALIVTLVLVRGLGRCMTPRPPGNPPPVVYPGDEPRTSQPYRFTPEQLAEIRTVESRFKGVETMTAMIDALGEPDQIFDQTVGGSTVALRRFRYTGFKTIDVEVQQSYGHFALQIAPKREAGHKTSPPAHDGDANGR
jgi:hypothetical protein